MAIPLKRLWCEKKTLQLIEEIKSRPCIWNTEHEDYNEKYSLATAWEEIATAMDMSELDLKTKWKTLRDAYRKKLKKNDSEYTSKWQYFDKLSFVTFKNTENEATQKSDEDIENQQECEVKLEHLGQSEIYWGEEDPIPDKRIKQEEDDFDVMFLKSLTPYLRELGPMRRLVVRSKMQDMLLNELAAQNAGRRNSNS
ncbi:uncharacterized protein LOC115453079 [Manduca sexta]|uniref:uncharacterized protein LOC115453079 n=1 Tax=Manduca sexta TaxID=7130 RepID=UPI0018908D23|nr:uncharacterized protein LOC115453079 [Manduca sexta]